MGAPAGLGPRGPSPVLLCGDREPRDDSPEEPEIPVSSRESSRRFHFIREIASGGFGSVYLAKVMHADGFSRLVAIKLLKAQWSDNDDVTRRIRDEARLLGLLRHRNIVDVIDLTSIDHRTAVVMEYLEAVDFRTVASAIQEAGGKMPVRAAVEAMAAVASALDAAYNRPPIPGDKPLRVIHRDIKPSNIMVDETGMVKVLDFGVARSEIENRESHTQELQFGSLDYMAPERLFFEPETPASDVYSLGATLYEVLALEKLGKAKGRPERHAAFLEERLGALQRTLGLEGEAWAVLGGLLRESMDFAHERRPSAAEFFQRARSLARLVVDEDLGQWAEHVIPPLVKAAHEAPREPNPLADVVLPEDSVALSKLTAADIDALVQTGIRNLGTPIQSIIPPMAPSIGDQLRRGALAELEDSIARGFAPAPHTGAPSGRGMNSRIPETMGDEPPTRTDVGATEPSLLLANAPDAPDLEPEDWTEAPTRLAFLEEPAKPADPLDEATQLTAPSESTEAGGTAPVTVSATMPAEATLLAEPSLEGLELLDPSSQDVPEPAGLGPMVIDRGHAPSAGAPVAGDEPPPLPVFPPIPPAFAAPPEQVPQRAAPLDTPTPRAPPAPAPAAPAVAPSPVGVASSRPPSRSPTEGWFEESAQRPAPTPPASPAAVGMLDATTARLPEPAAEAEQRSLLPFAVIGAVLGLFLVVGGVGLAVFLDVGGLRGRLMSSRGGDAQAETVATPPAEPSPVPEPARSGPALRFVSEAAGTARVSVECAGGKENQKGVEVAVPLESSDQCLVTAILEDRSRLRATVTGATAGTYRCFVGGKEACAKE